MSPSGATRAGLLLVLGVGLLYLRALGGEILDWDDGVWVRDPIVALGPGDALREALTGSRDRAWYPVLRLSWWLQPRLLGPSPSGAHAVNLGLFLACIPGLLALLRRCGVPARPALVAVALWAVHPTRVESVAWLSSRKDVLSLLLLIGSTLCLVPEGDRPPRPYAGTLLALLASLTKVAIAPVVAVIWLVIHARDGSEVANRRAGPAVGLAFLVGIVGIAVFHGGEGPVARPYPDLASNLTFAAWQLGAWTLRLGQLHHYAAIVPLPSSPVPLAILGLVVLAGLVAVAARGSAWARVLVGLAVLPLVPVSGIVPMAFWAADRHLLLPSLAATITVALAAERLLPERARWSPLLLAVPLSAATAARIPDWHGSLRLWSVDFARPGGHWVRGLNLGTALGRAGRFEEALIAFRDAEARNPGEPDLLARRLIAQLAADGDWSVADKAAAARLQPPPADAAAWSEAAHLLEATGDREAAADAARCAERLRGPPPAGR